MSFFVQSLTSNLEDIVSTSFYLSYHAGIQPSEVDRLTTYEFNKYVELLSENLKSDREYELDIAKNFGAMSIFNR